MCFVCAAKAAAYPGPKTARVLPFSTNASLGALRGKPLDSTSVVFHAAALCDFLVHAIQGGAQARKIPSTAAKFISFYAQLRRFSRV